MRYIDHDDTNASVVELAESLFERFVGRRLASECYEESIVIRNSIAVLAHTPVVSIHSIKAHLAENASVVPWSMDVDIASTNVQVEGALIHVPSSIFGVSFSSAHVVYEAGLSEIPDEIQSVVEEIAYRIAKGDMDEWSGTASLSDEAQETIAKYARGGEKCT